MAFTLRQAEREASGHKLLQLGRYSYAFPRLPQVISHSAEPDEHRVTVGAFCSIAEDVTFLLRGEHSTTWLATYPFSAGYERGHPFSRGPIIVGNDVWIGIGSMIMAGVTIGDGAIIGARSLVTHDVEPYTIVAGSPARFVKDRFSPEVVATLMRLRWWEWPTERIEEASSILNGGAIDELERFAIEHGLTTPMPTQEQPVLARD